jgi:hypothetical protein
MYIDRDIGMYLCTGEYKDSFLVNCDMSAMLSDENTFNNYVISMVAAKIITANLVIKVKNV